MTALPPFETNRLLSDLTTFRIGGPAHHFVEVTTLAQLQAVLSHCHANNLRYFILGKGSNVLFDDRGFAGLVIHNKISNCRFDGNLVTVGAGYSFALLGVQSARRGLSGLEFASGIPASVGGAIFMNAGAGGEETQERLMTVTFVTEKGEVRLFEKKELRFGYRHSSFQEMQGAIAEATFLLHEKENARTKQLAIVDYRTKTQPYGSASAGCVFKNPLPHTAGALIEKCGLKGLSVGGAEVSEIHANFIVNRSGATLQDVFDLVKEIQKRVKEQTGIDLEMEIRVPS